MTIYKVVGKYEEDGKKGDIIAPKLDYDCTSGKDICLRDDSNKVEDNLVDGSVVCKGCIYLEEVSI